MYLKQDPNENTWFLQTRNEYYQKNIKIKKDLKIKSEFSNFDLNSENTEINEKEKEL